jgi:hypothetical protein
MDRLYTHDIPVELLEPLPGSDVDEILVSF